MNRSNVLSKKWIIPHGYPAEYIEHLNQRYRDELAVVLFDNLRKSPYPVLVKLREEKIDPQSSCEHYFDFQEENILEVEMCVTQQMDVTLPHSTFDVNYVPQGKRK